MAKNKETLQAFSQALVLGIIVLLNTAPIHAMYGTPWNSVKVRSEDGEELLIRRDVLMVSPKIASMMKEGGSEVQTEGISVPAYSYTIKQAQYLMALYLFRNMHMLRAYLADQQAIPQLVEFLTWLEVPQRLITDVEEEVNRNN